MNGLRIIVIGASAGGVEALSSLFAGLNPNLNAAVFVVLHLPENIESHLPAILARRSRLAVEQAEDGKRIEAGHAYVAPPGRHLVIQGGMMRLTFGPRVNHARPAIDPLFESAAKYYGTNVTGVILTGLLNDGAKGLLVIKQAGGMAVVQSLEEALFPDMPASALEYVQVDYTLPVSEIASLLNRLSDRPALEKGEIHMEEASPVFSEDEISLIREEIKSYEKGYEANQRSVLTCPECGGVLWEIKDGKLVRYRCHTGHVYNAENLFSSYDKDLEKIFWTAIRMVVEKAAVSNRLAINAKAHGDTQHEAYYLAMAKDAEEQAERIRAAWYDGRASSSKKESAGEQANVEITRQAE